MISLESRCWAVIIVIWWFTVQVSLESNSNPRLAASNDKTERPYIWIRSVGCSLCLVGRGIALLKHDTHKFSHICVCKVELLRCLVKLNHSQVSRIWVCKVHFWCCVVECLYSDTKLVGLFSERVLYRYLRDVFYFWLCLWLHLVGYDDHVISSSPACVYDCIL